MVDEPLSKMGISVDRARALARFLEAYANTCLNEAGQIALNDDGRFAAGADAAVSLRDAAQWCLYTDPKKSAQLLIRSGQLYWSMGQPFGLFLQAASNTDMDARQLREALIAMRPIAEEDEPALTPTNSALQKSIVHPQQQAYLMLAYGGLGSPELDLPIDPRQILDTSPNRSGVVPVGALGTPIHRLWTIAMHLMQGQQGAITAIAHQLGIMCLHYQETMQLAQTNTYLWENGVSPVEVGDIDIAGIAALVGRRFGGGALSRSMENLEFSSLFKDIGMAPVEAGIELANHGMENLH